MIKNLTVVDHSFSVQYGPTDFKVEYMDLLPADTVAQLKKANQDKYLKAVRDRVVANTAGKLINEKQVVLGTSDYRGWEFIFKMNPQVFLRQRLYLVDGRLYQTFVSGAEEAARGDMADKFNDSLHLNK